MRIITSAKIEEYIGKIYTNYNAVYVGNKFSNAFLEFNKSFINDMQTAIASHFSTYKGSVSDLVIHYNVFPIIGECAEIIQCRINPIVLMRLYFSSHKERVQQGIPSMPPSLVAISKKTSDYDYYNSGGTYHSHIIDIVKKKRSSKRKPQFNYYDRNTKAIMFDYDFFSAFPFNGTDAEAWATDGHKYRLPSMMFIESKQYINRIIAETIEDFLNRELIA